MEQRGRILYLILGSLIVINEGASIIFALTGPPENFRWVHSLVIPAVMIYVVWDLWRTGDKFERWALAARTFLVGLTTLLGIGFIIYKLNTITPTEDKDFLFQFTSPLFTVQAIYGAVLLIIGLTLFLSPSIRVFLETRSQDNDQKLSSDPRPGS